MIGMRPITTRIGTKIAAIFAPLNPLFVDEETAATLDVAAEARVTVARADVVVLVVKVWDVGNVGGGAPAGVGFGTNVR